MTVTARYRKKKIRDLVVIVREADRTVLVSTRTDLEAQELGQFINELQEI